MSARRRWILATLLTLLTALAVAFEFVAEANPWRYTALMFWGDRDTVVVMLILAALVLGVIALLVVPGPRGRIAVAAVSVGTALVLCLGSAVGASVDLDEDFDAPRVLAVSPARHYELVQIRGHAAFLGGHDVLRVRSRAGLRSREAAENLACFALEDDWASSRYHVTGARFVGEAEVEVDTADSEVFRTAFDPRTLLASHRLSKGCG